MVSCVARTNGKSSRNGSILLFVLFFAFFSYAGTMRIVLLAGQSNMAGRGTIKIPDDTCTYPNIVSLHKDSIWVRAKHPLHWDKPEAGVGMGISFARGLSALLKSDDTIGLVPCAAGGTAVDDWLTNEYFGYTGNYYLYTNLIKRAGFASRSGAIIGMIWHQGESDATAALYPTYRNKLKTLFEKIRTGLSLPAMPIVAGELGRYLANNKTYPRWDSINASINKLKNVLDRYAVAGSAGLTAKPDVTHFTSASLDTFGIRYAELFYSLLATSRTAPFQSRSHGQKIRVTVDRNCISLPHDLPASTELYFYTVSGRLAKTASVSGSGSRIATGNLKGLFLMQLNGKGTPFMPVMIVIP